MEAIRVRPGVEGRWILEVDGIANPQHFRTGAQAEMAAKELAGRLSDVGQGSEIVIFLRDGTVAGRFVGPPA
jgi:hypothetical protein